MVRRRDSHWAIDCLLKLSLSRNIRELENIIERLVVVGRDDLICIEDIPKYYTWNTASLRNLPYAPIQNNKLNSSMASYEAASLLRISLINTEQLIRRWDIRGQSVDDRKKNEKYGFLKGKKFKNALKIWFTLFNAYTHYFSLAKCC